MKVRMAGSGYWLSHPLPITDAVASLPGPFDLVGLCDARRPGESNYLLKQPQNAGQRQPRQAKHPDCPHYRSAETCDD